MSELDFYKAENKQLKNRLAKHMDFVAWVARQHGTNDVYHFAENAPIRATNLQNEDVDDNPVLILYDYLEPEENPQVFMPFYPFQPIVCPVCLGLGNVQRYVDNRHSTHSQSTATMDIKEVLCNGCGGKGFVWPPLGEGGY